MYELVMGRFGDCLLGFWIILMVKNLTENLSLNFKGVGNLNKISNLKSSLNFSMVN